MKFTLQSVTCLCLVLLAVPANGVPEEAHHGGFGGFHRGGFGRRGGFGGGMFAPPLPFPMGMIPPPPMTVPPPMPMPMSAPPMGMAPPDAMDPSMSQGAPNMGMPPSGSGMDPSMSPGFGNQVGNQFQQTTPNQVSNGAGSAFAQASAGIDNPHGGASAPIQNNRQLVVEMPVQQAMAPTANAMANAQASAGNSFAVSGPIQNLPPSQMNAVTAPMSAASAQAGVNTNQGNAPSSTAGLGITEDGPQGGTSQPSPMPPQSPPDASSPPPQSPPQQSPPDASGPSQQGMNPLVAKGSYRKTESYSMQKSGTKTEEGEYQIMGAWDNNDIAKRAGRFENGRLMFSPLQQQVPIQAPSNQIGLITTSSIGYQGRCAFFPKSSLTGTCGYVPQNANVVSLPMKYMPNACNRCVLIKSGNSSIKAVVGQGCVDCGDDIKMIKLPSEMCPSLGVSPNSLLRVDWDFVDC